MIPPGERQSADSKRKIVPQPHANTLKSAFIIVFIIDIQVTTAVNVFSHFSSYINYFKVIVFILYLWRKNNFCRQPERHRKITVYIRTGLSNKYPVSSKIGTDAKDYTRKQSFYSCIF